eukprot:10669506-Heterocapsa_arctica.AAC.1
MLSGHRHQGRLFPGLFPGAGFWFRLGRSGAGDPPLKTGVPGGDVPPMVLSGHVIPMFRPESPAVRADS